MRYTWRERRVERGRWLRTGQEPWRGSSAPLTANRHCIPISNATSPVTIPGSGLESTKFLDRAPASRPGAVARRGDPPVSRFEEWLYLRYRALCLEHPSLAVRDSLNQTHYLAQVPFPGDGRLDDPVLLMADLLFSGRFPSELVRIPYAAKEEPPANFPAEPLERLEPRRYGAKPWIQQFRDVTMDRARQILADLDGRFVDRIRHVNSVSIELRPPAEIDSPLLNGVSGEEEEGEEGGLEVHRSMLEWVLLVAYRRELNPTPGPRSFADWKRRKDGNEALKRAVEEDFLEPVSGQWKTFRVVDQEDWLRRFIDEGFTAILND